MSLEGWAELACDCGSRQFSQISTLHFHESQGTTSKPDGWLCSGCNKRAPMDALVSRAKKLRLQKKIAELEAQV